MFRPDVPDHHHNRAAWDQMAKRRDRLTRPARDRDFASPLQAVDSLGWMGAVRHRRVLCLAAGGGRQGPLLAAAGADVTVVDLSNEMLALDRQLALERGLDVRTVQTSMDDLSMFAAGQFDIVLQPVSTCYVPQVEPVYRAVARVTAAGGLYISQHKHPTSLQVSLTPTLRGKYEIEVPVDHCGPLPPPSAPSLVRESQTQEYLHSLEHLLGGMCRTGFVIEDLIEPPHARLDATPGQFAHRSRYVTPYVRIKARKKKR